MSRVAERHAYGETGRARGRGGRGWEVGWKARDVNLRGARAAEMPRKEGERAAREPKRYRLELELGDTRARFLTPELDLANPPAPATWNGPALQDPSLAPKP